MVTFLSIHENSSFYVMWTRRTKRKIERKRPKNPRIIPKTIKSYFLVMSKVKICGGYKSFLFSSFVYDICFNCIFGCFLVQPIHFCWQYAYVLIEINTMTSMSGNVLSSVLFDILRVLRCWDGFVFGWNLDTGVWDRFFFFSKSPSRVDYEWEIKNLPKCVSEIKTPVTGRKLIVNTLLGRREKR